MKRRHFLMLAAAVELVLSVTMFVAPSIMLNDTAPGVNPMVELVMRIGAINMFAIGLINFAARRDAWSDSMKAILLGNATVHLFLTILDSYGYVSGLVGTRSVVASLIIHGGLFMGFCVMLLAPSRQDDVQVSTAR